MITTTEQHKTEDKDLEEAKKGEKKRIHKM